MSNNIQEALQLLFVGMITVFVILLIVINLGKLLIAIVNKYAPAEETKKKVVAQQNTVVDAKTKHVIEAAVAQISAGKGKIVSIEKL